MKNDKIFQKYICEEAQNCNEECFHIMPHEFEEGFCNDVCPEKEKTS